MTNKNQILLRCFSKFVCAATLFLIFAGGMVTSTGSGLSVPDWPLSYGGFFPPMVGGIFYEHGHRMIASVVGLLMVILAVWIARVETRRWVKMLSFAALGTVIAQGILGGVTVLLFLPPQVSVAHAVLGQTFFILTIILAYSQSEERRLRESETYLPGNPNQVELALGFVLLIYIQLMVGAVMRHTGSGLAIPDFPKMGGQWIPVFDTNMLNLINDWRFEMNLPSVKLQQVLIHFMHRIGAVFIIMMVAYLTYCFWDHAKKNKKVFDSLVTINILLILQVILGIYTVLTQKSPHVTSLHVALGAAFLGMSVLIALRILPLSINGCNTSLKKSK
ncbi:MAG: COX15/CtaA family protein [Candidatus Omnitrophota bacterium]